MHAADNVKAGRKEAAVLRSKHMITCQAADWRRLLQELIRIPSCFETEHAIVSHVCEYVTALGFAPTLVPMDATALRRHPDSATPISNIPDRNNVVVSIPGTGSGRSLILNCHLDINPEGDSKEWTHPPFSGHFDARTNAIFGRGAMDDKAGVAICLGLLRVIADQHLQFDGDLIFQFVLEDEITGNGSLMCLEAGHVADAAFILDGTRPDRAIDQHAGNMEFHIEFKGQAASVSVSHLGANAAEMLSRTLLHLREAFHHLNDALQPPWSEFPSPYQFVIHGMNANAPRFSLPITARARCFVTFPPPATIESVRGFLQDESAGHSRATNYPHLPTFDWESFAADPVSCATEELCMHLRQAGQRNGVSDIRIGPSTGTSDMRHFAKRGIPCLLFGPGRGFNPHRPDEHFLVDDLPLMMKLYLEIIVEWCHIARP
jgi:acetylornithine deacetylase